MDGKNEEVAVNSHCTRQNVNASSYTCKSPFKPVIPSESEGAPRGSSTGNLFGKSRNKSDEDGAQPVFLPDLKRFPQGMTFGPFVPGA
jgi:hypothetical protein